MSLRTGGSDLVSALSAGCHWWSIGPFAPLGLSNGISPVVAGLGLTTAVAADACYRWTKEMPAVAAEQCETDATVEGKGDPSGGPTEPRSVD